MGMFSGDDMFAFVCFEIFRFNQKRKAVCERVYNIQK